MGTGERPIIDSPAPLFGDMFRSYRKRGGLSQRKVARILNIDESTVARIEAGTRKPPRAVSFYERLRDLPGVTEPEIAALLTTSDAPRWLVGGPKRSMGEPDQDYIVPPFSVVKVEGITAIISLKAPVSTIHPDDVDDFLEIIKRTVALSLRDIQRQSAG